MLQPVAVGHKSLADYTHLVGRPLVEEIRELAEALQGLVEPAHTPQDDGLVDLGLELLAPPALRYLVADVQAALVAHAENEKANDERSWRRRPAR